jgi:hypothetical protein
MLLVRGAVLTPRLLACTLDLQIRVNSTIARILQHGKPARPHTFRRLQLTHAFETLGPRRAPVRRCGDVISVDSLTSGRELMVLVDVLLVACSNARERRSRVDAEERIRLELSSPRLPANSATLRLSESLGIR